MRIFLTVLLLFAGCGIATAGPQHDETMTCQAAAAAQITPPAFYTRGRFDMWADSTTACGTRKFTIKNYHDVRDGKKIDLVPEEMPMRPARNGRCKPQKMRQWLQVPVTQITQVILCLLPPGIVETYRQA
jgi:hypothetical protein